MPLETGLYSRKKLGYCWVVNRNSLRLLLAAVCVQNLVVLCEEQRSDTRKIFLVADSAFRPASPICGLLVTRRDVGSLLTLHFELQAAHDVA